MRFLLKSIKSDEAAQHPTGAGEMLRLTRAASCSASSLPPRSFFEGAPKEGEGGGRGRAGAVRGQWRGRGKGQGSVGGGHGHRGQGARRGRTFCWNSRVSDLMFEVQGLGFRVQSENAKGSGFGVEGLGFRV